MEMKKLLAGWNKICPACSIAVGSVYTLQDWTNALPASVARKLTIASKLV